jgi:hypothetical protein
MRTVGIFAGITALLSYPAVADVVRHKTIPEPFWGSWAPSTDSCSSKDKSGIVLSATSYVSPEANCAVYWVSETAGVRGSIYSARMRCSGAGKAEGITSNLIIFPRDANQILVGPQFGALKIYKRC